MLVSRQTKNGELSVQQVCDHLGVGRWVLRRLVTETPDPKSRRKGADGKLLVTKERGPGKPGQGGQYVTTSKTYFDWLGIPDEDRKILGNDGLPVLTSFAAAAEGLGIEEKDLRTLVDANGIPYILLVQGRRYLTASQFAQVRGKHIETSGSR